MKMKRETILMRLSLLVAAFLLAGMSIPTLAQTAKERGKYFKENLKNEKYVNYEIPVKDGEVNLTEVISLPGVSAKELYERAKLVMKNKLSDCLTDYDQDDGEAMMVNGKLTLDYTWKNLPFRNDFLFKVMVIPDEGEYYLALWKVHVSSQSTVGGVSRPSDEYQSVASSIGVGCMNKKQTELLNTPQAYQRIAVIDLWERLRDTFTAEMPKTLEQLKQEGHEDW